jgi:Calcineurin-like phosphoesterase
MPDLLATIVHISDLHFGGGIDHQLQLELSTIIRGISPQFLVVSGDVAENPFPGPMRDACRYIREIAGGCGIPVERTLVVPGNHDYKVKGNLGLRSLTRIPFEVYFARNGLALSRWRRFLLYMELILCWGKKFGDELQVRYDEQYGVAMFGFNSTPLFEMFATGKVTGEQISKLTCELMQEEGPSSLNANSVLDWPRFLEAIGRAEDSSPGRRILGLLSSETKRLVDNYVSGLVPSDTKSLITKELNGMLGRRDFYSEAFFTGTQKTEETERILERGQTKLSDHETRRLNRLLLEGSYPNEIAKCRVWNQYFKIAVVHHHPIPIPYVSTSLAERVQESFMVFYNAGAFLRELGRYGIDLVLHGHKHFAGFTRVAYDMPEGVQSEIGVLGAGSATHESPSDNLGNEFNVVRVYDDETVSVEQWYYATGVRRKDESRSYMLYNLDRVRNRRSVAAIRRYGLTLRRVNKRVRLTRYGYSEFQISLEGCRVRVNDGLSAYPINLEAMRPAYIRKPELLHMENGPKFPKMTIDQASHLRWLKGSITFGEDRKPSDGPFDIGYSFRLINGHALSFSEFQRKYAGLSEVEWEYASISSDEPADSLKLTIEFPQGFPMETLTCGAEALYTPRSASGSEQQQQHHEITSLIRDNVRCNAGNLELEVISPIPDFVYRIRWNYKAEEQEAIAPGRVREAVLRYVREKLVKTARHVAEVCLPPSAPPDLFNDVVKLLDAVSMDIAERYPQTQAHEKMDMTLFVFDDFGDEQSALRCVATNADPRSMSTLFQEFFLPGEGCAGFSFEKNCVVFYDRAVSANTWHYITPEELQKSRGKATGLMQHEVLITVPWIDLSGTTVGVLGVGSATKCSRLLRIFDMVESEQKAEKDRLVDLTRAFGAAIIALIQRADSEGIAND